MVTLLLEVHQLADEEDRSWPQAVELALLRAFAALLRRLQRRVLQYAADVLPIALAAAHRHGCEEGADAVAIVDAALDVGDVLVCASRDGSSATDESRWLAQRSALRLLQAVNEMEMQQMRHNVHARALQLCQSAGLTTWSVLLPALGESPPKKPQSVASDSDDDEPPSAGGDATPASQSSIVHGAGILALHWMQTPLNETTSPGDALRDVAPVAIKLLCSAPPAASCGALLVRSACQRIVATSALIGNEQECSELAVALATCMAHSSAPHVRTQSYDAVLLLLDAHTPWTRLGVLRALIAGVRDPSVVALLFKRIKDEAAVASTAGDTSPFGTAPAARIVTDWLGEMAMASDDTVVDAADAVVGALNVLRFMLLKETAFNTDVFGLRASSELARLRDDVVEPLLGASRRASTQSDGSGHADGSEHVPRLLAAQTVDEVAMRTIEALTAAAQRSEATGAAETQHTSAGGAVKLPSEPQSSTAKTGLRRGFLD